MISSVEYISLLIIPLFILFIAAQRFLMRGAVVGAVAAKRVQMTGMPELVALFNGSGGVASFLVALAILALVMGLTVVDYLYR